MSILKNVGYVAGFFLIILIILSTLLYLSPPSPFPQRKAGDPIEGYWYRPSEASGCFDQHEYIGITKDNFTYFYLLANNRPYPLKLSYEKLDNKNFILILDYSPLDRIDRLHMRDNGNRLRSTKRIITMRGVRTELTHKHERYASLDLTSCSRTSLLGRLKLAFRAGKFMPIRSPK